MVKIAQQYFEYGHTQQEIARIYGISRSKVSRLLSEAREIKLIEIKINYPWLTNSKLESSLQKKYNLKEVSVLESDSLDYEGMVQGIGILAAELLEKYLKDGMILGMARGSGVYSAVQALRPQRDMSLRIAQMQGAVGEKLSDGSDIAHFLLDRYDATFYFIHAPLILESMESRQALLNEPSIQDTLRIAQQANIALVGIGSTAPEVSSLLRTGHISKQELALTREQGSIGDVAGCFIQADGSSADIDLANRLICLDLVSLKKIPLMIGVAGGRIKAPAIKAAIQKGLVNILATDSAAAQELLSP